jgi:hypothetical protein
MLWLLLVVSANALCADPAVPRVAVDETTYEFGQVPRGTEVTARFTIHNRGAAPLAIEGMQFSTPGMRARVSATIDAGESAPLEIIWDTSQYSRDAVGQAALQLNDPANPTLVLTLKGFVVSPIEIDPAPAFYLSQFEGESSRQTVTIRVNQDRDVDITGIDREGRAFDIAVEPVEAGRQYALTATASADLAPGRYRESAIVHTNDPRRPRIRLEVNVLVKQAVHASVDAIDFGRVRQAALAANPSLLELLRQTLILEARVPDMQITSLTSDLDFIVLQREPKSPAQRVRVDVTLDPAELVPGHHEGTLHILTDVDGSKELALPIRVTVVE